LLEAYYTLEDVHAHRSALLWSFASITLLALVIFAGFQLSLGFTTVRWLHREQQRLLDRTVKMSEDDRRRLAADLHDGVVQDLAGVSYALTGNAVKLRENGETELAADLAGSGHTVRASIRQLRSMIVDLYPAAPRTAGRGNALADLAETVRLRGIDVDVETSGELDLSEHAQTLI